MFDMHVTVSRLKVPGCTKTCNQEKRQILTFDRQLETLAQERRHVQRILQYGNAWCCLYHEDAVRQFAEKSLGFWYLERGATADCSADGRIIKTRQLLLDRAWHDAVDAPASTCIVCIDDVLKRIDDYWQQSTDK